MMLKAKPEKKNVLRFCQEVPRIYKIFNDRRFPAFRSRADCKRKIVSPKFVQRRRTKAENEAVKTAELNNLTSCTTTLSEAFLVASERDSLVFFVELGA